MTTYSKKLIEVALPLDAINKASARERSIRQGHPSTLHLWWARRPLAAARAVIFAQMVDDPSAHPDRFPSEAAQEQERQRLFRLIGELVQWENISDETVLARARDEILKSWRATCDANKNHSQTAELFDPQRLPAFHDPFAGGGSLPLEAQRLGLVAYASDLNPVAVLICRAMIEIPPKFAARPPVNPDTRDNETLFAKTWRGAQGLAEDVRYYGRWLRDEVERRVGQLYPKVEITADMTKERPDLKALVGQSLTVVAWLWARTVKSPNPAFSTIDVPLASTFIVSTKAGTEAYVEPVIEESGYHFAVRLGTPKDVEAAKSGTKLARGANFRCVMSGSPIAPGFIYGEAKAGRMSARLMTIVAEGEHGRVYLAPTSTMEAVPQEVEQAWKPDVPMPENPRWFSPPLYGLPTYGDLFTFRQLVTLTTFCDVLHALHSRVMNDALAVNSLGEEDEEMRSKASAYADAVVTMLSFTVSRLADRCSTVCSWNLREGQGRKSGVNHVFSRQAIPMVWDFAEANPFSDIAASVTAAVERVVETLQRLPQLPQSGFASNMDAASQTVSAGKVISTDPPYYDNISYADLSDFFYVWLRRSLRGIYPELFATVAVPKAEELVATPHRHGSKPKAEAFFLSGMTEAMRRLAGQAHPAFPVTIYYAFKQSETEGSGTASTAWEVFLDAVIRAGFVISGTWPVRTERDQGLKTGTNVLASSIVLVCRRRAMDAAIATRREFVSALNVELPAALLHLQRESIAPVDLAQAAIGPGMAVYSRYAKVVDAEGKPVSVRDALKLINQSLDEVLAKQEGDFDADSRWALAWFEQQGFAEGEFGVADVLARAKNTSVDGMRNAGIVASSRGKVRLLKPSELPEHWDPTTESRLTAWETVHQLIRTLDADGEGAAAGLVATLGSTAEVARELAYRLYTLCERKKRATEALSYNALVQSWPEIARLAREGGKPRTEQGGLFADTEE